MNCVKNHGCAYKLINRTGGGPFVAGEGQPPVQIGSKNRSRVVRKRLNNQFYLSYPKSCTMLTASLIAKKRNGRELSDEEIRFLIDGFCDGSVADYQMTALAMAICLRGMTRAETASLTTAMWKSGISAPRRGNKPRVDKHSTGGLGDKVSLVLAPLLASCGVNVPMISGRGLGITGGTLDKLESIPGFRTNWTLDDAERLLQQTGVYIISAGPEIAPADRRLYALRDVTGTVESIPLITASILSKKLSASLDALVMDVKVGSGAFMKTTEDAIALARSLVDIGTAAGLPTRAILSDMDQPLGHALGNAIEVNEALDVLRGEGPPAVRELTMKLAAEALTAVGVTTSLGSANQLLEKNLDGGAAFEVFQHMVRSQGGSLDRPLAIAQDHVVLADRPGYVAGIDCRLLGETVVRLGGGRRNADDSIDPTVGISIQVSVGELADVGQILMRVYAPATRVSEYLVTLRDAIRWSETAVPSRQLVLSKL